MSQVQNSLYFPGHAAVEVSRASLCLGRPQEAPGRLFVLHPAQLPLQNWDWRAPWWRVLEVMGREGEVRVGHLSDQH